MATARECIKKIIDLNSKGRKLIIVDKFVILETYLAEQGITPHIRVTLNQDIVDYSEYFPISLLEGNKQNYYVIIPYIINEKLKELLMAYDYEMITDYCYLQEMHKKISNTSNYWDGFNNRCNWIPENLQVTFAGVNSKVNIGKKVNINGNVEIVIYDNANITIGDNSFIEGKFRLANFSEIKIGKFCGGKFQAVRIGENTKLIIDDRTTFTSSAVIIISDGRVEIGRDCMIAANNTFWCGDGHAIYDVNSGNCINYGEYRENCIKIGDHVWIGTKSLLLSNVNIQSGAIVGAGSVVKGTFPNNCVIAGNPACIKKKDIFWCRDPHGIIKEEEKEYFVKTL